ncbi:GreA/GreB family elongation factor [Arcobacter arenosus]|uniref:GreA/GreB family elongation factor n=1 Tax=Arcobacter arenosus TaxID=2576037 RepID=UPI003BA9AF64
MQKELITEFGYKRFVKEFKQLAEVEKPYWVKEKEIAAQHGDRSENAEYISAKEMIRNLDKRLRFLEKIINNSTVVETSKIPHEKVNFGSEVKVLDLDKEEEKTFIIVGTFETNPNEYKISNKSPLGKVLLGKELGEEFEFTINNKVFEYEIIDIKRYEFN